MLYYKCSYNPICMGTDHTHQTEYLTIDVATVVLISKQFKQLNGLCWLRVIPTDVLKSAW